MDLAVRVSRAASEQWGGGEWTLGKGYSRAAWTKPPLPLAGGAGGGPETASQLETDAVVVPTPNPSRQREGDALPHVVAIDYGSKDNIFRNLVRAGARVTVVPAKATLEEVLALQPDGVFLSNGPGDPAATGEHAVPVIKALLERDVPLFGICLGHQMLALAAGAKTLKMHQGHRGANHPVQRVGEGWGATAGLVEITSMNHGFAVDASTLPEGVEQTHRLAVRRLELRDRDCGEDGHLGCSITRRPRRGRRTCSTCSRSLWGCWGEVYSFSIHGRSHAYGMRRSEFPWL